MNVLTFLNAKGGVAKTTLNLEVASVLSKRGKRVLVIDLDQQLSLSKNCGASLKGPTIIEALLGETSVRECIQHNELFDIIIGSSRLSVAEKLFADTDDRFLLLDLCDLLKDDYDYIFLDAGPSRNIIQNMIIIAANGIIIPCLNDESSFDAVITIEDEISKIVNGRTHDSSAEVIGYVLNQFDNTVLSGIAFENLCNLAANKRNSPFILTLSRAVKMSEVKTFKTSVAKEFPSSKSGRELYALADEIERRYS